MDVNEIVRGFVYLLAVGFASVPIVCALRELVINNPRFWPELRFRLVFGFWPREFSRKLEGQSQLLVDGELANRAYSFFRCCQEEEDLRQKATDPAKLSLRFVREANRNLVGAQRGLARAKKRFWYAHSLAGRFGFAIQKKAGDYVDKDVSEGVTESPPD